MLNLRLLLHHLGLQRCLSWRLLVNNMMRVKLTQVLRRCLEEENWSAVADEELTETLQLGILLADKTFELQYSGGGRHCGGGRLESHTRTCTCYTDKADQ